jgi:ATP synthase F1 complex assembly factor 1
MATFRIPVLRHNIAAARPALRSTQRRWAQVHDVRFLVTHPKVDEQVLQKYKDKLAKKAKE